MVARGVPGVPLTMPMLRRQSGHARTRPAVPAAGTGTMPDVLGVGAAAVPASRRASAAARPALLAGPTRAERAGPHVRARANVSLNARVSVVES